MKLTPSQVKNFMRRGLKLLSDREPDKEEKKQIHLFFSASCAYCGCGIEKRNEDYDHLVPASKGGRNHSANRVLSCKICNAEKKLDKDWIHFLREICPDNLTFKERKRKIDSWILSHGSLNKPDEEVERVIEEESERLTLEYDKACKRIRDLTRSSSQRSYAS